MIWLHVERGDLQPAQMASNLPGREILRQGVENRFELPVTVTSSVRGSSLTPARHNGLIYHRDNTETFKTSFKTYLFKLAYSQNCCNAHLATGW